MGRIDSPVCPGTNLRTVFRKDADCIQMRRGLGYLGA